MDREAFQLLAEAEQQHWWFRGRREFIRAAIGTLALPAAPRLLDAGCGSGGNLALLAEFGEVYGFEYDAEALTHAEALQLATVRPGSLPDGVPFRDDRFDVVGLFDVLEHLPQPVQSLAALRDTLTPTGAIVITVPANPWMWGPHDELHQHQRRYTRAELRRHLTEAGLEIAYLSYFNALLLPLAIAQRLRERLFGYSAEQVMSGAFVNETLLRIWRLEHGWIPRRSLPFGLSLLAIATRGGAHD